MEEDLTTAKGVDSFKDKEEFVLITSSPEEEAIPSKEIGLIIFRKAEAEVGRIPITPAKAIHNNILDRTQHISHNNPVDPEVMINISRRSKLTKIMEVLMVGINRTNIFQRKHKGNGQVTNPKTKTKMNNRRNRSVGSEAKSR